jgi:adenylate cyclase
VNPRLVLVVLLVAAVTVLAAIGFLARQVSDVLAVLAVFMAFLGMLRLVHLRSPIRKRLREQDDLMFFSWCRSGAAGPFRRLYRRLPSDPRCRFCLVPFRGVGSLLKIAPSRKNPNFCPG